MRATLLLLVFAASGIAGLGYQLVWTRALALGLGHEAPSMLAVVAAFFFGLTLGAAWLGQRAARAANPVHAYALMELIIGVWGILIALSMPWVNERIVQWIGPYADPLRQSALTFVVPTLLLLPATIAMGATFPAIEAALHRSHFVKSSVGWAYAANTLGAMIGVILSITVLLAALGTRDTLFVFAVINFLCAGAAWMLWRGEHFTLSTRALSSMRRPNTTWLIVALITGTLGIGYELIVIRVLTLVFEGTVYSFAAVLVGYLAATAIGATLYAMRKRVDHERALRTLLLLLAVCMILGALVLAEAMPIYRAVRGVMGDRMRAAVLSEVAVAAAPLFLPAAIMGAAFSALMQLIRSRGESVALGVAVNTLGGAFAPVMIGALAIPWVGAKLTLLIFALTYSALSRRTLKARAIVAACLVGVGVLGIRDLHLLTLRDGEWVVDTRSGVLAEVAVVGKGNERNLRVDNRFQMGGTSAEALRIQRRQAHIPMLLHPNPQRVLMLGVASGVTVGAASLHPNAAVDAAELVPEVLTLLDHFAPQNHLPHQRGNVRMFAADARRFVRTIDTSYDIVMGDLFHPYRDGAGALYTVEHFQAIKARLNAGGVFCQWLPLYQLDLPTTRIIAGSFLKVFPKAQAYLAWNGVAYPALGLVGWNGEPSQTSDRNENDRWQGALGNALRDVYLRSDLDVTGAELIANRELIAFAKDAEVNTDDRPLVVFRSARFGYEQRGIATYARLRQLIRQYANVEATSHDAPESDAASLAYRKSRDLFLEASMLRAEGNERESIETFIASAQASPDFFDTELALLRIAGEMAASDRAGARELIQRLLTARPGAEAAAAALRQIN